jgi:hypothetical protein
MMMLPISLLTSVHAASSMPSICFQRISETSFNSLPHYAHADEDEDEDDEYDDEDDDFDEDDEDDEEEDED